MKSLKKNPHVVAVGRGVGGKTVVYVTEIDEEIRAYMEKEEVEVRVVSLPTALKTFKDEQK